MNTRSIGVLVLALFVAAVLGADTEAVADTEAAAKAVTEAAATATVATAAAATTSAQAEVQTQAEADKPKKDAAKPDPKKSFKPVMINRNSRVADVSQRTDIRYTDGGMAKIINFGPRPVDNRVEAEVYGPGESKLRRRMALWAAQNKDKKKYFTPTYADQLPRARASGRVFSSRSGPTTFSLGSGDDRYVSVVPGAAFFAPRIPTHFEPEYNDEHALLSGDLPLPYWDNSVVEYERSVFPRPSAHALYGLPQFPAPPLSAALHLSSFEAEDRPFAGEWDAPIGGSLKVTYPTGSGAAASLQKLDFALTRLQILNDKLRAAEAKVAASKKSQAELTKKIAALNRIRANLHKLAQQIASLETKVGRDQRVQAEVARVMQADAVEGIPVLGRW